MNTSARSYLFVPATSERKIEKAYASAADAIIVDLEDAVALTEKAAARAALESFVPPAPARPTWIRVNAVATEFCFEDLQACCRTGITGVLLPKVESGEQLRMVDWVLASVEKARGLAPRAIAVAGIVETALGVQQVAQIAAGSPRLRRLMFGALDLAADLGIDTGDDIGATSQARFAIACASRAADIEPPVDTAYGEIANLEGLRATATRAQALGYTGKACIHPAQIEIVNAVFTPSEAEVAWARKVVVTFEQAERAGMAAVALEGQMLDYPVVQKARRLLERLGPV
jgi:citrate lyase subunit beta / citryl-CoA lyase